MTIVQYLLYGDPSKVQKLLKIFPTVYAETPVKDGVIKPSPSVPSTDGPSTSTSTSPERQKTVDEMYHEYKDFIVQTTRNNEKEDTTGWERVKRTWDETIHGGNWEFQFLTQSFLVGGAFGFVWGTIINSAPMMVEFARRYNEMTYEGEFHAKRQLNDLMMVKAISNGAKVSWRFALFPTYMAIGAVTSLAYRNYVQPLDFALVAFLVGASWRIKLGPRAAMTAGGIMSIFGLSAGCLMWLSFWASGYTVPEFRFWNQERSKRSLFTYSSKSWEKTGYEHDDYIKLLANRQGVINEINAKKLKEQFAKQLEEEASTSPPPSPTPSASPK